MHHQGALMVWLPVLAVICLCICQNVLSEEIDFELPEKRGFSPDCKCCIQSGSQSCCVKCFNSRFGVTQYYSKRSESEPEILGSRVRRFTGCNCCYMSRFSNGYCCSVCNSYTKRWSKRSNVASLPSLEPIPEALPYTKRRNPDCYCCTAFKSTECCNRCAADLVI